MARYRGFGGLDDVTLEDGDVGFTGVNLRLPTWQLPPGVLALSENGRIDGEWMPRRGADVVAEGSLSNAQPLRLPFWLVDAVGGVSVTAASRTGALVTVTAPGHGLPFGLSGSATAVVSPVGVDNQIQYTADAMGEAGGLISIEYVAGPALDMSNSVVVDENAIRFVMGQKAMMFVGGATVPVIQGSYPNVVATPPYVWAITGYTPGSFLIIQMNLADVGPFPPGSSADVWVIAALYDIPNQKYYGFRQVGNVNYQFPDEVVDWEGFVMAPALGGNPAPSMPFGFPSIGGTYPTAGQAITAINADPVASALVTATAFGPSTGSLDPIGPVFLQGGVGGPAYLELKGVSGTPTVDPNGVWFTTPTNANTLTFNIPGATGSESYTVTGASILSELDDESSDTVFGSCLFSDPSSNNDESIFLAFGTNVKRVALADGSVTSYGLPGSDTIDEECDMVQAMDKVFIFRSGKVAFQWQVGDTDFSEVESGAYTQPQVFTVTGTAVSVTDGLCTISGLTNSTVSEGDDILIYDSNDSRFLPFKDEHYMVTAANGTSFSFYIPVANLTTIGANTLSLGRQVSIGGGFIHQPAFPWAIYFQRRIWGPYWFTDGTPFVDRNVRDELIASDVLDPGTYDPLANQFRITAGIADYIMALHPFYDDTLLVMNRNSIHGVFGTRGSLADTSVRELTREIGCLARKSVVSQGGNIFFLSDAGVYVLNFYNDYNLRGVERPLSDAIQPYMDRISATLATEAVGIYFNKRYYLAVALDSSPGAGDSIGNNAILIYNLENQGWESVDTFGDPAFLIKNLIIGSAEKRNDLYAVTAAGGIHILEAKDNDYDILATNFVTGPSQFDISSIMRTRAYMCGTGERKRFIMMGVQMKSGSNQSDVGLAFTAEDPDNSGSETLVSNTMGGPLPPDNTADVRQRIGGVRGFNGQVTVRREIGRPSIRSIRMEATITNRETLTQK